ncbi:Uncharacterised protein [Chlamydia abortus]|uniref:Uncharacterized protein n=1 Tax=Paenibacillus residui TaxID=629724 RepID=A0ABW3D7A3_9BACL|nr:Uncharacterised protein [Chlamydia abortus]
MSGEALAVQTCIEIRREIRGIEEIITEASYEMKLYEDEITVRRERFPLHDVFDISFFRNHREEGAIGFLYLHTKNGVRTFYIRENPDMLIEVYKKLSAKEL